MFLKQLLNKNEKFINTVLDLYNKNLILPDTYCIDVDTFMDNSKKILDEANKYNIKLFYMLKQVGRNPYLGKKLEEIGYAGAVLVDFKEVEIAMKNNLKLANIGHLVQIPKSMIKKCLKYGVDFFTAYSIDMIKEIDKEAKELGIVQNIMLRILDKDSSVYPGQEAGIFINELKDFSKQLKKFKNVNLIALTSFPCFLYNDKNKEIEKTYNLDALKEAKYILEKEGFCIKELNMPSVSCIENMKNIYENGGTQAEPGHALSGTTPNNVLEESKEIPAYLYISEISHIFNNKSYFYGGGYYPRSNIKYGYINNKIVDVNPFNAENIDYYISLNSIEKIFSPIIFCFRTQIFVTRSDVLLIEKGKIIARYSSQGEKREIYE